MPRPEIQDEIRQRVILAVVDTSEYDVEASIEELKLLVETAGGTVVAEVIQRLDKSDSKTYLGPGKLIETLSVIDEVAAEILIVDTELSAAQFRNIRNAVSIEVIDRTTLILDIFAQSATTAEGKIQVELAQLQHRLLTLTGAGEAMSRLGGGIGTRGPGETKLETDRRRIRARIAFLQKEIKEIAERRTLTRTRRKKGNIPIVSLVGYTNVGKSSLLNALTGAEVLVENRLFATLDSTVRRLSTENMQEIVVVDTVGFVSRLPHHLVDAFQSTLEEMAQSDIIVKVADGTSSEWEEQLKVADEVIAQMNCTDIEQIVVFNKCDLFDTSVQLPGISVSAKTKEGLDLLLGEIDRILLNRAIQIKISLPFDKLSLTNIIREKGKVLEEEYIEEGLVMTAVIDKDILHLVEEYILQ